MRLVLPTITSLSPSSGGKHGGYLLTINGTGFGDAPELVQIGGQPLLVQTWTDTAITAIVPDTGNAAGFANVKVQTFEKAWTNGSPFTLTD